MNPIGKLFRSAAFRLALAYLAVFALFATVLIGYVAYRAQDIFEARTQSTIAAEVRGLAEQYAEGGIQRLASSVRTRSQARNTDRSLYLLTAFSGARIAGNISAIAPAVMRREGLQRVNYVPSNGASDLSGEALVHVFPLEGGFALLVGRDVSDQHAFEGVLWQAGSIAAALMLLLGIGGGFYISRRVLSRIDTMADTSGAIMAGNLSERVPVTGAGDEFDRLAERLNAMLARIEALVQGMREVTDNVAHDLRTPLTRLKARAEDAMRIAAKDGDDGPASAQTRQNLEGIIDDADGLIRVFNALLAIARTEAGEGAPFEPVDVAALLEDAVDLYQPLAEEVGASITLSGTGTLDPLDGNRELLAQAVANLIDNAIKYGLPEEHGGAIAVSARQEPDAVIITVADKGPGIAEAERGRVLGRFVRLDQSRNLPGSGLGLSLVAAVARAHGGELMLGDNAPGLAANVRLPRQSGAGKKL